MSHSARHRKKASQAPRAFPPKIDELLGPASPAISIAASAFSTPAQPGPLVTRLADMVAGIGSSPEAGLFGDADTRLGRPNSGAPAPEYPRANGHGRQTTPTSPKTGGAAFRRASDIRPEPIDWLRQGTLARGKVTLFVGGQAAGKTSLAIELAARISSGRALPTGSVEGAPRPESVAIVNTWDSPGEILRPRLEAAGADLDRVWIHSCETLRATVDHDLEFSDRVEQAMGAKKQNQAMVGELGRLLDQIPDCGLLVVDALPTGLEDGGAELDRLGKLWLEQLAELASERHVAVLAIVKLGHATGAALPRRSLAALVMARHAHAVWTVARDPADLGRRLLLPARNGCCADELGYEFRIDGKGLHWSPAPVAIADEAAQSLAAALGSSRQFDRLDAACWLRDLLAHGRVASKEVIRQAKENGHSWGTVRRAKQLAGVEVVHDGFGAESVWYWRLAGQAGAAGQLAATAERKGAQAESKGAQAELKGAQVDVPGAQAGAETA
ncbi:MAG TPA: AAA family ATPase [Pirellulales bacterium]|nr:AAA family ATPase [Pirellulales bacterium]